MTLYTSNHLLLMFLGFFFVGNAFLCKITSFHLEVPRPGEFESVTSKIFSLSHTFFAN